MARIDTFQGGRVQIQPGTGERVRASDFGPGIAPVALGAAGKAVGEYAEFESQLADQHNRATVKEAATAVEKYYAEQGFTGGDPYYSRQGKAALNGRPALETGLDEHIGKTREALNPEQRRMFDLAMEPQRIQWGVQIATHADKETRSYEADATQARVGMSSELAKKTYLSDPDHGEEQIDTALAEVDALGVNQGWSPERIQAEKLKTSSSIYRDIGKNVSTVGGDNGPALIRGLIEKHGGSMTADDRNYLTDQARITEDRIEAERRFAEREAARLEREARQDAKGRADSVARNVDDGVPVADGDLAGAIEDASKAGDPALAERLRQGGMKNSMTRQWANASPQEMQEQVNDLSAQITREGDKVKPDTIVQRDHLATLLGKAKTEIEKDPISWGAKAFGINPGPLNLGQTGSIQAHVDLARKIQQRTGRMPNAVMTDDDAAVFAPIAVNGTVKQKTALAVGLARFGPLASVAARQVAPNNAGFQNLVGLAGLPNKGIASSRVNQIVSGQEILKTSPKLVKKDDAMREFQGFTKGALQFLPSIRQGVYENATAILANDANEKGVTEWAEASPRWFAAVNSALGAYSKDGKQIGGLSGFNGGMTVVPTDMPVEDFERRISRSNGEKLRGASNGLPVYSDGREPTVNDIRKMHWVPIGDGIYRVGTGAEFLRLKDGNFFVVNVRKLP